MITEQIKKYIKQSVLCWMATADSEGMPNVSPKEVFIDFDPDKIIIANIASPGTARNIKLNNKICLSFIDVFEQMGFQLKGEARIVDQKDQFYEVYAEKLLQIAGPDFPFTTIFECKITRSKEIIAPRYLLFPETTIEQQIKSAYATYRVRKV